MQASHLESHIAENKFSRSKERAESAISRLKTETGKEAFFIQLDLSDLDSVRKAADEFKS
jgi:short-subunit dehydrogenase